MLGGVVQYFSKDYKASILCKGIICLSSGSSQVNIDGSLLMGDQSIMDSILIIEKINKTKQISWRSSLFSASNDKIRFFILTIYR